jgi:hypothetical protein
MQLSKAFDVGLEVRFRSLIEMFKYSRGAVRQADLEVEPFQSELERVTFVDDMPYVVFGEASVVHLDDRAQLLSSSPTNKLFPALAPTVRSFDYVGAGSNQPLFSSIPRY